MKVIIIKECKEGKINDVVEVSNGYATNFLIKKGLALPYNSKTGHMLKNKLKNIEQEELESIKNAENVKKAIENLKLSFKLKVTNMIVHGSVTKKQILKELLLHGVKLGAHAIENVKITSLGITNVDVKIYKNIIAKLKVEVKND